MNRLFISTDGDRHACRWGASIMFSRIFRINSFLLSGFFLAIVSFGIVPAYAESVDADNFDLRRIYIAGGADNVDANDVFGESAYVSVEVASGIINPDYRTRIRAAIDVSEVGYWGGAGFSAEYRFDNMPAYIEGSFLAGLYMDSDELDLGHAIEFRSQVSFGYIFSNGYDLAVGIGHKSNAGLSNINPGANAVFVRIGRSF